MRFKAAQQAEGNGSRKQAVAGNWQKGKGMVVGAWGRAGLCVLYIYADTHTKASTDLRLCLLTLFQVDGATHTHTLNTHTHTGRRYTLFGSGAQAPRTTRATTTTTTLPNSKCRGGNY